LIPVKIISENDSSDLIVKAYERACHKVGENSPTGNLRRFIEKWKK